MRRRGSSNSRRWGRAYFFLTMLSRRQLALSMATLPLLGRWSGSGHAAGSSEISIARIGDPETIEDIAPGQWRHFEVEGSPVFVHHLTPAEVDRQPCRPDAEAQRDESTSNEWLVVSGLCTHAACRVLQGLGRNGGFLCPCHGSEFNIFGEVIKGPARRDLPKVAHMISDGRLTFLESSATIQSD